MLLGIIGAAGFVAAAAIAFVTGVGGGGSWLPLHLALGGGAGLAIVALLPHFTVSLAAARPAPARARLAAEACIAAGVVAVAVGFPTGANLLTLLGAGAYLAGIAISAATAFIPARAGLGRRFGIVEAAYGLALANAAAAVVLAMLRVGGAVTPGGAWLGLKPAHAWLNLVGFLSLVVAGTLIHLYPTVVGSRIRSRPALVVVVAGIGLGAPCTAIGYAVGSGVLAIAGSVAVMAGAAGLAVVATGAWSGRGRWTTDPDWHRLTIGHLTAAIAWFWVGTLILAAGVLLNGAGPAGWSLPRVVGPIVIGWALQALIGSWSHLLPSVGPGDAARHAAQRRELGRWATARLVAWNIGVGLVAMGAIGPAPLGIAGAVVVGAVLLGSIVLLGRALVVRGAGGG